MTVALRGACVLIVAWIASAGLTAAAAQSSAFGWSIPAWAAPPIVPADNPMTVEKVTLGRYLFYDKRLSYNGTFSCGTCHQQRLGFTDSRPTALGSTGQRHPRRTATLTNVGYNTALTWANPTQRKLEIQMLTPMFGDQPVEMGFAGHEMQLLARLRADERYRHLFEEAFPGSSEPFTLGSITKAIASFERTLISLDSPYDRYRYGGDPNAIGAGAKRGESLFFGEKLECFHCHEGINFSDNSADARTRIATVAFHNTGLYNIEGRYPAHNAGVYEITGDPRDDGAFKTPTLRNVAVRAPYMHDGSVRDLNAALDHYSAGGRTVEGTPYAGVGRLNPNKDVVIHGFALDAQERRDLIAFLETLTDTAFLTDPALSDPFAAPPASNPTSGPNACHPRRPDVLRRDDLGSTARQLQRMQRIARILTALVDQERTFVGYDRLAALVVCGGLGRHDAHVRPRRGLALEQYLARRIDGVPDEDGRGQPDSVPADVGHDVLG